MGEVVWKGVKPKGKTWQALIHHWSPDDHYRHPKCVRDAIFWYLLFIFD